MPRQTNIFKIDRRDVQEQLALAHVLKRNDDVAAIKAFCKLFSIPLDETAVRIRLNDLQTLRDLIIAEEKRTPKK